MSSRPPELMATTMLSNETPRSALSASFFSGLHRNDFMPGYYPAVCLLSPHLGSSPGGCRRPHGQDGQGHVAGIRASKSPRQFGPAPRVLRPPPIPCNLSTSCFTVGDGPGPIRAGKGAWRMAGTTNKPPDVLRDLLVYLLREAAEIEHQL